MKTAFFLFLCFLPSILLSAEYTVGNGSEFKFTGKRGENISLSIYITESTFTKLGVEYFFTDTNGFAGIEVWQQFSLGLNTQSLSLDAGYILSNTMKNPEIMSKDFLNNNRDGVNISDFFFKEKKSIDGNNLGMETIEVPAGKILSTHYQKKRDDQTVDFWISEKAGDIGLVKLISKGKKNEDQSYSIELMSLLKNVKPKINPQKALPLSDKGRMFLGKNK